jgi:hypothetical protein
MVFPVTRAQLPVKGEAYLARLVVHPRHVIPVKAGIHQSDWDLSKGMSMTKQAPCPSLLMTSMLPA